MPMSRTLLSWLSFSALLVSAFAGDFEFSNCDCDGEGFWSSERILQAQKVSDCLIATAYFSIPLELLYFVSCSHVFPFKWILFQFVAFIVLCGLSHLLTVFTYKAHSFLLMLSLTVSKFLTALVSFATAITLLTLIPQLLRVKVRENFLRIKAQDLDRRVEMMKREEEASWQVRVLTQEIRRSLDREVILFTTVVELSKILGLQNCAVWMPNEDQAEMNLTHEVEQRSPREADGLTIPMDDPDVVEITKNSSTMLLSQDSLLGFASSGHGHERGAAVAIRMPLLKASDFKGGTAAAAAAAETSYAILVLVLREDAPQEWGASELGVVEVVADQVAVALLHAGVLEESQRMREKLEEQNQALQQARMDAMMANKARNSFHNVTSHGMRRPVHSILGLLSMFQQETLSSEQRLVINTMMKMSSVTSALIGDITESPDSGVRSLVLETKPFHLHTTIKEAAAIVRFLCDSRGFGFGVQIDNDIPNLVYGDEKRVFQVILHTAGDLLNQRDGGFLRFSVLSESGIDGKQGQKWVPWKASVPDGHAGVRFEIGIKGAQSDGPSSSDQRLPRSSGGGGRLETRQKFGMCKKLVQVRTRSSCLIFFSVWIQASGVFSRMILDLLSSREKFSRVVHGKDHRTCRIPRRLMFFFFLRSVFLGVPEDRYTKTMSFESSADG